MTLVNEGKSVVFLGKVHDFWQGSDITIHGEDTIGHDHTETGVFRLNQILFQILKVEMLITKSLRFAKSNTIYDRGMVELI
jgi:hypothetical protein